MCFKMVKKALFDNKAYKNMGIILKLVTLALAVLAVLVWLKVLRFESLGRQLRQKSSAKSVEKPAQSIDSCAYCGVFLPRNTAFKGRHGIYCCQEHLTKGEAKKEDVQ